MADMTAATLAVVQAAIWSTIPTVTNRSNVVLWPMLDHTWEPELGVGRGDRVNVYGFTQNTGASNRGAGSGTFGTGATLTFTANTELQTQIIVNRMYYMADRMTVESTAQVIPSYVTNLAKGRGMAIALNIDADVAADNTNGIDAFSTVVGTDNVDVTEDTVFTAETNLNNANAPAQDRYFVVSPATRASLFLIESFRNQLNATAIGNLNGNAGPGPEGQWNGYFGHALTFDFYMSNNLEAGAFGKKNGAFHRQAIAAISQMNLQTESNVQIEAGLFRQNATFTTCGFKLMKSTFGYEVDGK